MEGYHIDSLNAIPSVGRLEEFVRRHLSEGRSVADFASFESQAMELVMGVARDILATGLQSMDVHRERVSVDDVEYRRVLEQQTKEYMSAAGVRDARWCAVSMDPFG